MVPMGAEVTRRCADDDRTGATRSFFFLVHAEAVKLVPDLTFVDFEMLQFST